MRSPSAAAFSKLAISSALLTVRSFSIMSSRLTRPSLGKRVCRRAYMLCGTQPSGSSGPASPSMPTLAPVKPNSTSRSATLSPKVARLGRTSARAAPVVGEDRRIDERGRLAVAGKDEHVELGIAADRAEVARIGDVEVPHRRPAAQDQAIEGARVHLLAHRRPAPVALLERGRGIFHELAHGGSLSSESCAGLTRASIFFAKKFL